MFNSDAKLGIGDAEAVARWFLYRVKPEQRRALMGDMPQVYARMFPDVDPAVILAAVAERMAPDEPPAPAVQPRTDSVLYGDYNATHSGRTWRIYRHDVSVLNLGGHLPREMISAILTALQGAYDGE